jgi:hypothetical protein
MTKKQALGIALECVLDTIQSIKQDKMEFTNHPNFDKFLLDYRTDRINRYNNKIDELRKVLNTLD